MLKPKEAALVLAKINAHHGNMQLDRLSVQTFHEELRQDATLAECMEAVRRFYAGHDGSCWCRAGDVNAEIRRMRAEQQPSEAEIENEMVRLGVDSGGFEAAWLYRRMRIKGIEPSKAAHTALTTRSPLFIQPPSPNTQERRSKRPERAFAGDLHDIIGKETK
jgi:hypothetical protein